MRDDIPMSALPFFAALIPAEEPGPCTSMKTSGFILA
ncbi:Uncharacterised protein [Vibrio cholerae]|nr:Uncharacterised protein [Vibrio cholerae]